MRKLIIPLPSFVNVEKAFLDADYSSGTILTVINNYGFADNDIVIVGEPGNEKTESKDVTSQTGNTIINISGALKFPHNKSDILYKFEYDQYEIYRYRSNAWTLISTSNIQWDKLNTIYIDTDGLSTDSYRFRLLNSVSAAVSDYSPTVAATGFTSNQVGYMLKEVRMILGDMERKIIKTDDEIIRQFNRAQDIIKAVRPDWWFLRKENSQITTIADTRKYGLNTYLSDMEYIDSISYNYNNGTNNDIYKLHVSSFADWDYDTQDQNVLGDDRPSSVLIRPPDDVDATGYLDLNVKSLTTGYGTFKIRYIKKMTPLESVADETDVPIPSILVDYALYYGFSVKGDDARAKMYQTQFYGPQPGQDEKYQEPTGIRLLEHMQASKGKSLEQPESIRTYRGRGAMARRYSNQGGNSDYYREHYW